MMSRLRIFVAIFAALVVPMTAAAQGPVALPAYDLDIKLDPAKKIVHVRQRITWTNPATRPTQELVLNVHPRYKLPAAEVGMTAKMFEIMRVQPGETLDLEGRAGNVANIRLLSLGAAGETPALRQTGAKEPADVLPPPRLLPPVLPGSPAPAPPRPLEFSYRTDLDTALIVPLPRLLRHGESVTIELDYTLRLPQRQGRWGTFENVTTLANWLPVLAFYDAQAGWQPTPFLTWHQPFFNEAGLYSARLTLPADLKVGCTAPVQTERICGNGTREIVFAPTPARDFAILASARYQEFLAKAGDITVRCLAFPQHEYYARFMAQSAAEALKAYAEWFGPYPYPQYTIAESSFGWNANECAGLLMVDERIFGMPHMASGYVDYLIAHGTCHQWWYNMVGTNGHAETWMDEGPATFFAYRLMQEKHGRNDRLVNYPRGLTWLPNVRRDDYRHFNLYGTIGRGEAGPTVQDLPKYEHIVNVYAMCYERGSKVIGMIEARLGPDAFLGFMRHLQRRYKFQMLRVADFQRELESYSNASWEPFFKRWVYGSGMTDWCIESVDIRMERTLGAGVLTSSDTAVPACPQFTYKASVVVKQRADYDEPTVLGFCFDNNEEVQLRVPVVPQAATADLQEIGAFTEALAPNVVRVEVLLPRRPTQILVDPDQVLVDRNPSNNAWKSRCNCRFTALYSFLEETDLTNSYDRWNFIAGPWVFAPTYDNPFFTRATRFGFRAGTYRTAQFEGGVYTAYRTDYRDFVTGVDAILEHWPYDHAEIGFVAERRLAMTLKGQDNANRGVIYARHVLDYGDSLYLPPFQYVEGFTTIQDDLLPDAREVVPGAERFKHQAMAGLHYHVYYLTPYWDPEGGFALDLSYAGGVEIPGVHADAYGSHQFLGTGTYVQSMPDGLGWFSESKFAFRGYGAFGLPNNIQYFALGGGELFRGFDLAQRQGNALWVTSAEWRFPILQHVNWGLCDRAFELRNINCALFTDVGDIYQNGHTVGGITQAVGAGLRLDVSWFTFVERTILRLDAARTLNSTAPMQFWLGVEHPF